MWRWPRRAAPPAPLRCIAAPGDRDGGEGELKLDVRVIRVALRQREQDVERLVVAAGAEQLASLRHFRAGRRRILVGVRLRYGEQ